MTFKNQFYAFEASSNQIVQVPFTPLLNMQCPTPPNKMLQLHDLQTCFLPLEFFGQSRKIRDLT